MLNVGEEGASSTRGPSGRISHRDRTVTAATARKSSSPPWHPETKKSSAGAGTRRSSARSPAAAAVLGKNRPASSVSAIALAPCLRAATAAAAGRGGHQSVCGGRERTEALALTAHASPTGATRGSQRRHRRRRRPHALDVVAVRALRVGEVQPLLQSGGGTARREAAGGGRVVDGPRAAPRQATAGRGRRPSDHLRRTPRQDSAGRPPMTETGAVAANCSSCSG
jgi:hypothetical protein